MSNIPAHANDDYHESRITRLEVTIENINKTLERFDKRFDMLEAKMDSNFKELNTKMDTGFKSINDRMWANFLWTLSTMFLFSGILCGIMAKGFHWFS